MNQGEVRQAGMTKKTLAPAVGGPAPPPKAKKNSARRTTQANVPGNRRSGLAQSGPTAVATSMWRATGPTLLTPQRQNQNTAPACPPVR